MSLLGSAGFRFGRGRSARRCARQRAEGAAELERLKQMLAERVEFVRMRERELEDALGQDRQGRARR